MRFVIARLKQVKKECDDCTDISTSDANKEFTDDHNKEFIQAYKALANAVGKAVKNEKAETDYLLKEGDKLLQNLKLEVSIIM